MVLMALECTHRKKEKVKVVMVNAEPEGKIRKSWSHFCILCGCRGELAEAQSRACKKDCQVALSIKCSVLFGHSF